MSSKKSAGSDPKDENELLNSLIGVLDEMQKIPESIRATILLAGASVILRDIAQLPGQDATATLKTIRDLSSEYLSRRR